MMIRSAGVLSVGTALLGGVVACGGGGPSQTDEGVFIERVSQMHGSSAGTPLHPWVVNHLDAMLVEGRRACRWIAARPSPHDAGDERSRYQAVSVPMPTLPTEFGKPWQGLFADTAWRTLCHPVFLPEPED